MTLSVSAKLHHIFVFYPPNIKLYKQITIAVQINANSLTANISGGGQRREAKSVAGVPRRARYAAARRANTWGVRDGAS